MSLNIFNNQDLNKKFNQMRECTLSINDTLDLIIKERLSVARYGDGEMQMVNALKGCAFESPSYYGTSKLRTILQEEHEKLLVCINGDATDEWWNGFWKREFESFSDFLQSKPYGNTFISRSPAFHRLGQEAVMKWKKIWDKRKVVFITGEGSRFDCQHTLFDNIDTYKVILSSPTHAIKDIPRLIHESSKEEEDTLFIIALGPAATILAYELTLLGYQAIDIGHITNCYDVVFNNGKSPEKLPFKNI